MLSMSDAPTMHRSPSHVPRRWSPDLGIPWAPGIVAHTIRTCPAHAVTLTSATEAGQELRAAIARGGCTCGYRYAASDLVSASGVPWSEVADRLDPAGADPDPSLPDLFAAPSMLGGGSFLARAAR